MKMQIPYSMSFINTCSHTKKEWPRCSISSKTTLSEQAESEP